MKRKPFLLALSLLPIALAAGCTAKEEHISIQKYEHKTYQFIAYKQKIDMKDTEEAKEILRNAAWHEFIWTKEQPKADFIFYFNDDKKDGDIPVFYVWVDDETHVVELTRDQHKKHVQLNPNDSKTILRLLNE
ncbi:hypothetical protein [Peribacillus sp. SI8-4]|uniref:hypothetical protein n=1 Tax=Peribacillus sp. SI8-4 TaxID=3048009 RepID=UPI002555468F|nr:hypothetical protein [Peribacillus sp. SI8-4]